MNEKVILHAVESFAIQLTKSDSHSDGDPDVIAVASELWALAHSLELSMKYGVNHD